jgi:hypothetical protein
LAGRSSNLIQSCLGVNPKGAPGKLLALPGREHHSLFGSSAMSCAERFKLYIDLPARAEFLLLADLLWKETCMPIKTIIAGVALEADTDPVLERALQLAQVHEARLILVHVLENLLLVECRCHRRPWTSA